MSDSQQKFQQLLRELFQFDCADLDFGIYRIMNYKRAVIERFIANDLPRAISEELDRGTLANQAQAARDLESARKKVLETLGKDALDAEGKLSETYSNTPVGKEYLAAQEQAKSAKGREALEASVYNHLSAFFSRYWQDGDFISKRRYSKKERYAIPYNGEEVYLYWANHDQYYVKTGEYFTDYTWKAPNGATVHFKLKAADVEQNNVKGDKRFFLPRWDEVAWDAEARTLTIPFEFRPLTAHEAVTYGQRKQQEAIITKALEGGSKTSAQGRNGSRGRSDSRKASRRWHVHHPAGTSPAPVYPPQHQRLLHPQGPEGLPLPRAGLLPEERGAQPGRIGSRRREHGRGLVPAATPDQEGRSEHH